MYVYIGSLKLESESVEIGGCTGSAVLDEFLLCFRLDPLFTIYDGPEHNKNDHIMSRQIVIPGLALCLVTTGCVDVIAFLTPVVTSLKVLVSCLVGPL